MERFTYIRLITIIIKRILFFVIITDELPIFQSSVSDPSSFIVYRLAFSV